jgi:hypothetical protein
MFFGIMIISCMLVSGEQECYADLAHTWMDGDYLACEAMASNINFLAGIAPLTIEYAVCEEITEDDLPQYVTYWE